jgi:hypothetical protein
MRISNFYLVNPWIWTYNSHQESWHCPYELWRWGRKNTTGNFRSKMSSRSARRYKNWISRWHVSLSRLGGPSRTSLGFLRLRIVCHSTLFAKHLAWLNNRSRRGMYAQSELRFGHSNVSELRLKGKRSMASRADLFTVKWIRWLNKVGYYGLR